MNKGRGKDEERKQRRRYKRYKKEGEAVRTGREKDALSNRGVITMVRMTGSRHKQQTGGRQWGFHSDETKAIVATA